MFEEINVLGGGKIGSGFVLKASRKFPNVIFNLITRNKAKFINNELNKIGNVNILSYDDIIKKDIICFYCISANEQKIIEEEGSRNKNINRMLILKHNMKIAHGMVDFLYNIKPSNIFVVTNPVEIISSFLNKKLPNINIFGLGLELDSKRIKDLLGLFFNLDIDNNLFVLGNHSLFPIPLLSNTLIYDKFKNITISNILLNLKEKKNYNYGNTEVNYYGEFYNYVNMECLDIGFNDFIPIEQIYKIISYFIGLLVKSEFDNNKPPVENPIDSLVLTLSKIFNYNNSIINVSYFSDTGVFTGGLLKINGKGKNEVIRIKVSEYEKDMVYKSDLKLCTTYIDSFV